MSWICSQQQPEQPMAINKRPRLHDSDPDNPSEILWGVEAIAKVLGRSRNATYHLVENGMLKGVIKIGAQWTARKSVLLAQWDTIKGGE